MNWIEEGAALLVSVASGTAYVRLTRAAKKAKPKADPEYIARMEKELGLNQPRTAADIHRELDGLYRLAQHHWTTELADQIELKRAEYTAACRVPEDLADRVRAKEPEWLEQIEEIQRQTKAHIIRQSLAERGQPMDEAEAHAKHDQRRGPLWLNPGEETRLWLLADRCTCHNCARKEGR